MPDFLERLRAPDNYWRSVILFGRNVASYKFALAQSRIELSAGGNSYISLQDLAIPFSRNLIAHLRQSPKQATSTSSRFLEACREADAGKLTEAELVDKTVALGFNNVIDAFHIVNRGEIPVRFFVDERKGQGGGIRLTDKLFQMREASQFGNLSDEIEARWRLVETAWELGLPKGLVIGVESDGQILTAPQLGRRAMVAQSRGALNGYQKGRCFYCFGEVSVVAAHPELADVDHFFPRVLLQLGVQRPLDGVWNLVLACRECNRGVDGKSARLPEQRYLERLHTRNEFLISSHHPLRETLIAQTGDSTDERAAFLNGMYAAALRALIHRWSPKSENEVAF